MGQIILLSFGVYGISLMLSESSGPFDIFARLRKQASVFRCFDCTAVWVAMVLALYPSSDLITWLIWTFGLAGIAVFLNRVEF